MGSRPANALHAVSASLLLCTAHDKNGGKIQPSPAHRLGDETPQRGPDALPRHVQRPFVAPQERHLAGRYTICPGQLPVSSTPRVSLRNCTCDQHRREDRHARPADTADDPAHDKPHQLVTDRTNAIISRISREL